MDSFRRVFKYTLDIRDGAQNPSLPVGAEIVHVAMQVEKIRLWAVVDIRQKISNRLFVVVATGQPIEFVGHYTGTVHDGIYVWHVFEVCKGKTIWRAPHNP